MDVRMPDGTVITNVPDDITQTELQRRFGLLQTKEAPPSAGFSLADTATALKQGVVGSAKALTDVFGAENVVSKKLGDIQNQLGEEYTPARKAEMARREDLQRQAAKTGTVKDEISTFLAGVAEAPVQSLAQGLGSIVPYIGTGIVGAIGKLAAPTIRAVNTVVGAAQGAGSVKGSLYDNVKNELVKSGVSEQEADRQAKQAQEYLGANFLDIMGGTALGGVAARFGVENLLTPGASAKLSSNLVGRMTKAAAAEAPLEGVQAGQEQLAVNRGLQKEGFNVGTFEGVAGAAARDAAVGALVGSAVGIRGPGAPAVKPDANKTIADEDKSQEVKNQEAALQNKAAPPVIDSELELQLNPVIDSSGKLIQEGMAPPPAPPVKADETFDMPTSDEKAKQIADLEAKINERQPKLDSKTHPNMPAATIAQARDKKLLEQLKGGAPTTAPAAPAPTPTYTDLPSYLAAVDAGLQIKQSDYRKLAKEAGITIPVGTKNVDAIAMLKAKLAEGGQDVTKEIDTTAGGVGAGVLGGPETGGAPAVPTGDGRPGVADAESTISAVEDGTGAKQPALDQEVIDEQALADQEAAAAAAAEQAAITEEAAAELAGEAVYEVVDAGLVKPEMPGAVKLGQILTQDEYDAANEEFGEGAFSVEQVTPEVAAPEVAVPEVTTPEAQTKRDEIVTKVSAFEDIRKLLSFPEKLGDIGKKTKEGVQGDVFKEEKVAKPIKWRGPKDTETEDPSSYNFLNKNSYYSDKSPEQIAKQSQVLAKKNKNVVAKDVIEAGIEAAAFDEAYDLYDSIAYEKMVLPEIKQIMAERQTTKNAEIDALNKERKTNREAKRAQMTRDGKSEKVIKEALSVIKDAPKVKYSQEKPLEFMSEQEVLDLFKKNIGTKTEAQMAKEGGQARINAGKDRQVFIAEQAAANVDDALKFGMMTEAILDLEIISAVRDNKITTAGDRRTEAYRQKQEKQVIKDVKEQLAEAELSVEEAEAKEKAKAERIAARAEERKKVTKEVQAEAKEKKSKLVAKIESAIVNDDLTLSKDSILDTIKDRTLNDRMTGTVAAQFLNILTGFPIQTKIKFGKLEANEDGKFDPKTNTITIKGTNKDGYSGARPLPETVMHEVSHATLDHVFDNEAAFIKSLEDQAAKDSARRAELDKEIKALEAKIRKLKADKKNAEEVATAVAKLRELRAEFNKPAPVVRDVRAALNRLKQNHKVVLTRFGKKYNIETLKEFAAEFWSNSKFQQDLALMASPTPYTPKENFFTTIVKNIANALGISNPSEGAVFKEIAEDLAQLISVPSRGIRGKEVSYATTAPAAPKKPLELRDDEEIMPTAGKESAYALSEEHQPKDFKYIKNLFFTKEGWRRIATALQNERYPIKRWQDLNDLAGKTIYEGKDKINNIYDQLTLSTSRAKNIFSEFVEGTYEKLNTAVYDLSKTTGMEMKDVMDMLHRVAESLHDPERRLAKYVMTVPLSTIKDIPQGGTMISAADRRAQIMKILNTKTITDAQARALRSELNTIVFTTDANGNQVPNTKYVTPAGSSPSGKKDVNPTSEEYNATGLSPKAVAARRAKYEALDPKIKTLVDDVFAQVKELHRVTTDLNKTANYWSQPVSNRVAFYGFENYVPLKGVDKHSEADEMMDFDSAKMGKELQEVAHGFDGRVSVSENPILQSMSDAVRAAMRAGRKELTQSIKNSVGKSTKTIDGKKVDLNPNGQGLLEGEIVQRITFEERQDENVLKALPKENTIFHYNEDGSIDVIAIRDRSLREAIRRTYKDTNSLVNVANKITSSLGMMHTRYNYNFAPLNFVRDALTNAWAIGAEMGPGEAARFITQIANKVVTGNSLGKGMKIARLYETKDYAKIRELAKKDPIYKEMAEFIEEGGMVQYLQGISLKSNAEKLYKEVGRGGVIKTWDQFNRLIDIWTDMFELSSRSAAYAIAKKNFKDHGATETAAKVRAAAYAKNLANFEQVGKYGREMGAAFMFFRPSATGAVRAIEAVAPAFQNLDKVVAALPERISKDPAALAKFKANYAARQKAARYMTLALGGAGAIAYYMAIMAADEDDLGRNKVMNDDMSQWTRFARFYIPGFENPLQVPWGFGLGAFASGGAQLAGVLTGQQSIGGALGNLATQIMLDSFVPIPVSRMPISDDPAAWMVDSLTPSMLRPMVEFVMNKNGLGQDIYNDSNRRMGDAYLGGDNIPETYKILANKLHRESDGSIDISPNTLYFLANSYIDGPARVVDSIVNATYLIGGSKEFKAKTDLPLVGSFIGAVPNVDSREFKSMEKQIEAMEKKLKSAETDPEALIRVLNKNPFAEDLIEIYRKGAGGELNRLRQEANEIRRDPVFTPKDKTALLKINMIEQNIAKHSLVEDFKAYGLKP